MFEKVSSQYIQQSKEIRGGRLSRSQIRLKVGSRPRKSRDRKLIRICRHEPVNVCQWRISKTSITSAIISGPKTQSRSLTRPHAPPVWSLYSVGDATFQREIGLGMGNGPGGAPEKNAFTEQRWVIDSGAGRGKLSSGARELDILQLLEAKPLAVDRHTKVAKVDGVLGTGDFGAHHRVRCRPPRTKILSAVQVLRGDFRFALSARIDLISGGPDAGGARAAPRLATCETHAPTHPLLEVLCCSLII